MSFLNNLGQKISDVSQTTIKKTKDLADTAKLNLNISEEERKIDTAYEQIGKWYVENIAKMPKKMQKPGWMRLPFPKPELRNAVKAFTR